MVSGRSEAKGSLEFKDNEKERRVFGVPTALGSEIGTSPSSVCPFNILAESFINGKAKIDY